MKLWIFALSFWAFSLIICPENLIHVAAQPFQTACLTRAKKTAEMSAIVSAVVCGKRLPHNSDLRDSLIQLSLIHLFVVSGAHLALVKQMLTKVAPANYRTFRFLALGIYGLFCGATSPVVRALLQTLVGAAIPKCWRAGGWQYMWAGLLCLWLLPSQWTQLSLPLSWSCAVLLFLCRKQSSLKTCAVLYIGLLPLLLVVGIAHPIVVLVNLVALPLLSVLIFPCLAANWMIPALTPIVVKIWRPVESTLHEGALLLPYFEMSSASIEAGGWPMLYCFALQCLAICWHSHTKRAEL
jgi:predicted membrane metal-binding protein